MSTLNYFFSVIKASVKSFVSTFKAHNSVTATQTVNVVEQSETSSPATKVPSKHEHRPLEIRKSSEMFVEKNDVNPFNTMEKPKQKRSGKGRGATCYNRINFNKYFVYSKELKPSFDTVREAAIDYAKKSTQHIYMTRITTDSEAPVMFFAVDKINDRDTLSSMRRCYIDFYNNHKGQLDQDQELHISSKAIFKIK